MLIARARAFRGHTAREIACLNADWLLGSHRHRSQPTESISLLATNDGVELFLHSSCDGTHHALTDTDLVHRSNRSDLRRCAGEKTFVGDVQHFAWDYLLDQRNFQLTSNSHH